MQGASAFESDNNGTINPKADKGFTVYKPTQALKNKLEKVAAKFGLTIEYFNADPDKSGNGSYAKGSKVIRLNETSKKPTAIVFSHELVHYLVQDKLYSRLQNILFKKGKDGKYTVKSAALKNWLKTHSQWKQGYADLNFAINAYAETYKTEYAKKDANGNYKYDAEGMAKVEEELIADFLADALFGQNVIVEGNDITEQFATEIQEQDQTLWEKIKEWFTNVIAQFKDVDDIQQDLKRIAKKLQRMQSNLAKQKTSTEKGEVRKSLNENLSLQLNDWLTGNGQKYGSYNGKYFDLGTTPDILKKWGAKDVPFIMYANVIDKITGGKHSISLDELGKLPAQLNDPILLFKGSVPNSFVALTELLDKQGNDVIVAIHINRSEGRNIVNKIVTAYSKTNDLGENKIVNYVNNQISQNNLIDGNIKKASNWFTTHRLQLPRVVQTILTASTNNIPKTEQNVNTQNKDERKSLTVDSEGNTLTEAQQEYFKDSKVRDENGNLLVMYQGALNEFYEFDRKKSSPHNLYGRGFYFTESKSRSEMYGNSRAYYLNIKNPIATHEGDNVITKPQLLKFLQAIEQDGEDYDLYNYGEGATPESVLKTVWGKSDFAMLQDINAAAIGDLVAAIELFNEVNGTDFDGIILATETITFTSNQAKLTTNETPTESEDIRYSKNVDIYTEEQYNNFGWVSANDLWTPQERETLLSRYADFKHNKDKYPVTRFGEAVIHSFDLPNIIVYIEGTIKNPQITKIVRINLDDYNAQTLKEWILEDERRQVSLPVQNGETVFGKENILQYRKRDIKSFQEYRREQEGKLGTEDLPSDRNLQDGTRDGRQVNSVSEAEQLDSAFSMPKDERLSKNIDLTTLPDSELSDAVENETITMEQAEQELMRRYGKIPNSFKPKQNIVLTTEETQKENFATSEFIDNVLRNGKFDAGMTDEQKAEIIKAITEHKQHKVITDENTIKKVQALVENDYQKAVWEWLNYTNQKNVPLGKEELALGQQLLQHAAENGNAADTVKYLAELTEAATRAGQAVQAFSHYF